MRVRLPIAVALLLPALTAVGASNASAQRQAMPAARVLSESEVAPYLATLRQLAATGKDAEKQLANLASDPQRQAAAIQYSEELRKVLESHGLDAESFSSIHWNMMTALAAVEMDKHAGQLEKARSEQAAQLQAMKGKLPPAQYEQLINALEGVDLFAKTYEDVPAANKALVEKHRAELESILKITQSR